MSFDCVPNQNPATGTVSGSWFWSQYQSSPYALGGQATCPFGSDFKGVIPGMIPTLTGAWVVSPLALDAYGVVRESTPKDWHELNDQSRHLLVIRHMEPLPTGTKPKNVYEGMPNYPFVKPGATEVLYSPLPLVHGTHFDNLMLGATTHALGAWAGTVDAIVVNVSAVLHLTWKSGSPVSVVAAPDHPMAGKEDWEDAYKSRYKYPALTSPVSRVISVGGTPTLFVLQRFPKAGPYAVHAWPVTETGFGDHQVVLPQLATAVSADLLVAPRSPGAVWLALADFKLKDASQAATDACFNDYSTPGCGYAVKLYSATASSAVWLADLAVPKESLGGSSSMRKMIQLLPLDGEHVAIVGGAAQLFVWSAAQGLVAAGNLLPGADPLLSSQSSPFGVFSRPDGGVVVLTELPNGDGITERVIATAVHPTQGVQWSTKVPIGLGGLHFNRAATAAVRADGHTFVYGELGFFELDERGNLSLDPLCFGPKAPNCDDGDPCTLDMCDSNGKCQHAAKANGTFCAMAPLKFCKAGICTQ